MANRSQFGTPPATGGSGGIGDVVGPSSAVNNNLAAFDTTTGKLLEDSGIATSQVATSQTAADATARLALTGLARGARVYQTDNGFWYELTNAAAPSDAASWQAQPKVYKATLTQTSTNPPVATVQENGLGQTMTWGYGSTGAYTVTAGAAAFTANKTRIFIGDVLTPTGEIVWALAARTSTTVITITTNTGSFSGTSVGVADDILAETAITIEVYPA